MDLTFLGRTSKQLYRCMAAAPFPGVVVFDATGAVLDRITINGEEATFSQWARDGSVPRGVAGAGLQLPDLAPNFPGMDPGQVAPTWAPSDWEQP